MGNCSPYDHGRQAQIYKQADPFCIGSDPEAFQDLAEKTVLPFTEEPAVLLRQSFEDLLLLFNRQYSDPLLLPIAAVP